MKYYIYDLYTSAKVTSPHSLYSIQQLKRNNYKEARYVIRSFPVEDIETHQQDTTDFVSGVVIGTALELLADSIVSSSSSSSDDSFSGGGGEFGGGGASGDW